MSLDLAHEQLDWPDQKQVLTPRGAGPKVMAELAKAKIGQTLRRLPEGKNVKVGVLTHNADSGRHRSPHCGCMRIPRFCISRYTPRGPPALPGTSVVVRC